MKLRSYRDLTAWQKAIELVLVTYTITAHFPRAEMYGLAAQMRRAAVSIPSNIAEGYGRLHRGDYLRFVSVARGSLFELETQILIAQRLQYIRGGDLQPFVELSDEVSRILAALIRGLQRPSTQEQPKRSTLGPNP